MEKPGHINYPEDIKYVSTHQWAAYEEGTVTVGITDYAQQQLGDIVFIDLPDEEDELLQGDEVGTIESVKAASDLFTPMTGTVIAVNPLLEGQPELINLSPYGDGWLFKLQPSDFDDEWDALLDADAYAEAVALEQEDT